LARLKGHGWRSAEYLWDHTTRRGMIANDLPSWSCFLDIFFAPSLSHATNSLLVIFILLNNNKLLIEN
jgi:hypothetical protein